MKNNRKKLFSILPVILLLIICSGCAKRFVITTPMELPIELGRKCSIGNIVDEMPTDFDEEKKPKQDDIEKLKMFLAEELNKKNVLHAILSKRDSKYVIEGAILDFKKGSGVVRAFIGFGIGDAKITTNLYLRDRETGDILFGGNFTSRVSDYKISGEEIFKQVAKDFSKQLHKELIAMGVNVFNQSNPKSYEIE